MGDWLQVIGGSTLSRDGVVAALSSSGPEAVKSTAEGLGVVVTVVFCTDEASIELATEAVGAGNCVIGIVPDLDARAFIQVLRTGAAGVMWEHAPGTLLRSIAMSALHQDMLLPSKVVRQLASAQIDLPEPEIELDPISMRLLNELADGKSLKEMSESNHYSERTVQRRVANLCLALGAQTPAQAVHIAHRRGILAQENSKVKIWPRSTSRATMEGVLDPAQVDAGDVVIVRQEGPRGGPGMQEMLYLTAYKSRGLGKERAR